jgi:hypothetical protein
VITRNDMLMRILAEICSLALGGAPAAGAPHEHHDVNRAISGALSSLPPGPF